MKVEDFLKEVTKGSNIADFVGNNNLGLIALAFAVESLGENLSLGEKEESCCEKGEYPKFSAIPYSVDSFLSGKDEIINPDQYYEVGGVKWVQSGPDLSYGYLLCPECGKKEDVIK